MIQNAKIIFYFNQYYVIRLGENIYQFNPKLERFILIRALFTLLSYAFKINKQSKVTQRKGKRVYKQLVYIETINQKNALIDVFLKKENKNETIFILNDVNVRLRVPSYDQQDFPTKKLFLRALSYFPKAVFISRKYIKKQRGVINGAHILINLSLFMASLKIFEDKLNEYKTRQVIIANDHNLHTLALLLASRNLKIKTYYIQHASVSPAFPKLLPEVSFLEGQQAIDTYKQIGNLSKRIHLVGISRLDGILNYKKKILTQNITVGFCLKPYYSQKLIENYIQAIQQSNNVGKIILRPHPGNSQDFYTKLEKYNVEISNAQIERPHEFIKKLDVLISGESSIILEASLMKVKTIYIDDQVAQYDLYGFVKNDITTPIHSIQELKVELRQIDFKRVEQQFINCQYYCSTVDTEFQNKSNDLILKILCNDK